MPVTATTPDRLRALAAGMLGDLAPDWPASEEAVLTGWDPGDAELAA